MIKFGTSGWRAIIADQFTFDAVRQVTQAIVNRIGSHSPGSHVVVGYDTRFMAETFAEESARLIAAGRLHPLLTDRATPTPAVAFAIRSRGASGGINFTASHNPPTYCGMKFSTADGAPALPEVTEEIEREIAKLEGRSITAPATERATFALSPKREAIAANEPPDRRCRKPERCEVPSPFLSPARSNRHKYKL